MRTLRLHGGVRRPLVLLLVGALVAAGCSSHPPGAQGTDGVAGGSPASVSVGGAPTVGPAPTQGPAAAPPSPSPGSRRGSSRSIRASPPRASWRSTGRPPTS